MGILDEIRGSKPQDKKPPEGAMAHLEGKQADSARGAPHHIGKDKDPHVLEGEVEVVVDPHQRAKEEAHYWMGQGG